MFRNHELHALTGSYVLDAVESPERERFERHLHRCPSCTAEVGRLRETAARLAIAAAARPPAHLREQVLATARRTRQPHPVTVERPRRAAEALARRYRVVMSAVRPPR